MILSEVCRDCGRPKGWHEVFCPELLRIVDGGFEELIDLAGPAVLIRKLPEVE